MIDRFLFQKGELKSKPAYTLSAEYKRLNK